LINTAHKNKQLILSSIILLYFHTLYNNESALFHALYVDLQQMGYKKKKQTASDTQYFNYHTKEKVSLACIVNLKMSIFSYLLSHLLTRINALKTVVRDKTAA